MNAVSRGAKNKNLLIQPNFAPTSYLTAKAKREREEKREPAKG